MIDCPDCRLPELCDRCRNDRYTQLRGVAALRGTVLRDELARRGQKPVLELVRERVADLARDGRLREMLAAEALRWALRPSEQATR